MRLKVSSAKRRPFCLGLNELIAVHLLLLPHPAHLDHIETHVNDMFGAGTIIPCSGVAFQSIT